MGLPSMEYYNVREAARAIGTTENLIWHYFMTGKLRASVRFGPRKWEYKEVVVCTKKDGTLVNRNCAKTYTAEWGFFDILRYDLLEWKKKKSHWDPGPPIYATLCTSHGLFHERGRGDTGKIITLAANYIIRDIEPTDIIVTAAEVRRFKQEHGLEKPQANTDQAETAPRVSGHMKNEMPATIKPDMNLNPANAEEGKAVLRYQRDMPSLTVPECKERLLELAHEFNKPDYALQAEEL